MKRTTDIALVALICVLFVGCATTHTSGTKFDQNAVSKISKGVTTRAEVEAAFGPPLFVAIIGEGRRIMTYTYSNTSTNVKATTFIPIVGAFIGGATTDQRTQNLQIILNKNDVVEDYEFSDKAGATDMSGGLFNTNTNTTPVAPQNK